MFIPLEGRLGTCVAAFGGRLRGGAAPGLRLTYSLTELYQCPRPISPARYRS